MNVKMSRAWRIGGTIPFVAMFAIGATLLIAGPRDGMDASTAMLTLLTGLAVVGGIEFQFKEFFFHPDHIDVWRWFRWHRIELPPRVKIRPGFFDIAVKNPADGRT